MLVLSRRPNETIVFPDFDAAVQVLSVRSGKARLGIEAPPNVRVLRQELAVRDKPGESVTKPLVSAFAESTLRQLRHAVRNRLNAAAVGLALLRRQLHAGLSRIALQDTLVKVEQEFEQLHEQVEAMKHRVAPERKMRPPKVLLVEDDRNECELMAGFLRLSGMEVDTAGDGAEALDHLQSRSRPDVVLMDMVLPQCDGPAAVRCMRSDPRNAQLKIFAVTGYSRDRFGLDIGRHGVDRWFEKPVNPETLLRELNQELRSLP